MTCKELLLRLHNAHAKRKKKTLVPWMMKKLSKDERKILDRETEASGHKGIYIIMQLFN